VTPPTDVLVVGGGPAGLALALGARRAGLAVTVLDRSRPPIDKPCGEGLMPDGVAALAALGVDPARLGGRPFHGIRYLDAGGEHAAEARFPGGADAGTGGGRGPSAPGAVAEARFPSGSGLGVRRTRLHAALAAAAAEAGAELSWGVPARGLERHGDRFAVVTDGGVLAARWIVAADGLGSRLRRWAGLDGRPPRRRRFGVRRHVRIAPWTSLVEVWWADGCEAYVTPVAEDEVGIAMLWNGGPGGLGPARFDGLLARFPALAARLAGAEATSRDRGAGPLARRPRALSRCNLVLLGDAAGYLDAITGEGLSLAFHQAAALAPALAAGDLAAYERAHRRLARLPEALIRLLLAVERRPPLRRRLIRALAADPALFARLLAVHARALPLSGLGLGGPLRLAGRLAAGSRA
jgi:flavin-dependent dehydrogenase